MTDKEILENKTRFKVLSKQAIAACQRDDYDEAWSLIETAKGNLHLMRSHVEESKPTYQILKEGDRITMNSQ